MGIDFAVTISSAGAGLTSALCVGGWNSNPSCCDGVPEAVLYAILDRAVDDYGPVLAGSAGRRRRDRKPRCSAATPRRRGGSTSSAAR